MVGRSVGWLVGWLVFIGGAERERSGWRGVSTDGKDRDREEVEGEMGEGREGGEGGKGKGEEREK